MVARSLNPQATVPKPDMGPSAAKSPPAAQ